MKSCTRCMSEKPLDDFNNSSKARDGKQSYCRDCAKAHYRGNLTSHKARVKTRRASRKLEMQELILPRLAEGCVDCGNSDIRVLDFDHRPSTIKIASISELVGARCSNEKLETELNKCDVRCRNCHAIITQERLGGTWRTRLYMPQ